MLFNTPEFIFLFAPAAVALHFFLARRSPEAAAVGTFISSLIFYAWWNPPYVLLPLVSIGANFWIAQRMTAEPGAVARRLLVIGIVGNLAVLLYYKYTGFILSVLGGYKAPPPDVPLALSFTTFVQIAFLVEIYRRRTTVDLRQYALFVAFFPHLIAGPIVRWSELGPQIKERFRYRPDWDNIALGITIFAFGLAKKVLIADPLSVHVAPVFDAAARGEALTAAAAWGAAFAYSAQLYFDFSGYSDMAVGLGLLFNLRLPINFAAPFRSTSIIDLWRRWHITLSRFLRDFVYIPLGGGRGGPVRTSVNLVATMAIGGLWHGANWTFVAWGLFHGVLLAVNHGWRLLRGDAPRSPLGRFAGWLATFIAFAVGMVFFRAADIDAACNMLTAMSGFGHAAPATALMADWDTSWVRWGYVSEAFLRTWFGATWSLSATLMTVGAMAVALLVPDTMEIVRYTEGDIKSPWRRTFRPLTWRPSLAWSAAVTGLVLLTLGYLGRASEFLYYQF
ncbi:MAG: MBOAT family O-acyltransferase [Xanthobacteraceae bacterium]